MERRSVQWTVLPVPVFSRCLITSRDIVIDYINVFASLFNNMYFVLFLHDIQEETITFYSSGWRCKYLDKNSIVISPALYLKSIASHSKANQHFPSSHIVDLNLNGISSKQTEGKCKVSTVSSEPSTVKCTTMNKDKINGTENGRIKRLISIMENNTPCRDKEVRPEKKTDIPKDQYDSKENVGKDIVSRLCAVHINKKNCCLGDVKREDKSADLIENYKDAIAKLKHQKTWQPSPNSSESLVKASFHGHIQKCILQLHNSNTKQLTNPITCGLKSSIIERNSGGKKCFEGENPCLNSEHSQTHIATSPQTSVTRTCKAEKGKFEWSQTTQELSKDVWGFPAFHPYPLKTPFHLNVSYSSRTHTRSGKV
ncbi:Hypothetical predicted protein [Pelobates cultripes]|uniref:Uncharacterized protein n=1 Tax=Pelobates cultripes TaxID=61616 RepID=A0AAD1SVX6_PELCU|nr:Hypothetical predicted protein [Pelobates cultripes]